MRLVKVCRENFDKLLAIHQICQIFELYGTYIKLRQSLLQIKGHKQPRPMQPNAIYRCNHKDWAYFSNAVDCNCDYMTF